MLDRFCLYSPCSPLFIGTAGAVHKANYWAMHTAYSCVCWQKAFRSVLWKLQQCVMLSHVLIFIILRFFYCCCCFTLFCRSVNSHSMLCVFVCDLVYDPDLWILEETAKWMSDCFVRDIRTFGTEYFRFVCISCAECDCVERLSHRWTLLFSAIRNIIKLLYP